MADVFFFGTHFSCIKFLVWFVKIFLLKKRKQRVSSKRFMCSGQFSEWLTRDQNTQHRIVVYLVTAVAVMELTDARLSAIFAGTFVVAYVIWKFVHDTHTGDVRRPLTMWSLPLIGSLPFLPDTRLWHKEFLRMSTRMGNVFAFYIGSRCVSCIL